LDGLIYNDEYNTIDENLTDSNVGGRKDRNIRDNIFVLNAISNSVLKDGEEDIDIQVFDIEKCFDALWVQECINDIYDAGLTNDKLPLLFLENVNGQCAIKVNDGKSKRINIKEHARNSLGQFVLHCDHGQAGQADLPGQGAGVQVQRCGGHSLSRNGG
jgi:hypothetical protein